MFQVSNCDFINQGHTHRHEQFGSPGHKLGPGSTEDARGVSPDRSQLQESGLSDISILIIECDGGNLRPLVLTIICSRSLQKEFSLSFAIYFP